MSAQISDIPDSYLAVDDTEIGNASGKNG